MDRLITVQHARGTELLCLSGPWALTLGPGRFEHLGNVLVIERQARFQALDPAGPPPEPRRHVFTGVTRVGVLTR